VLQATAEAKAEPPKPPNTSKWTCTLCLTTMTPKNITAHKQGKRHMAALAKVDKTLSVKSKSECSKAGAYDAKDTGVSGSNIQTMPTATSFFHFNSPTPEARVPPAFTIIGKSKSATFSKSPTKAQKKNRKTAAKPKEKIKSVVPPPIRAEIDDWQLDGKRNGWFIDSFPSYTHISSLDYSICDKDCGWCGKCMDDVSLEYDLLFLLYCYYTLVNSSEGQENGMGGRLTFKAASPPWNPFQQPAFNPSLIFVVPLLIITTL